jgi:hypothetical protein
MRRKPVSRAWRSAKTRPRAGSILLLSGGVVLLACSSVPLPTLRFDSPFGGDWVAFRDGIVVESPRPAVAGNFVNLRKREISVRVELDDIEGDDDCASSFRLGPEQTRPYACPQSAVAEGKRFRVEVRVYTDLGETDVAERIHRIVELRRDEEGRLVLVGRPLD